MVEQLSDRGNNRYSFRKNLNHVQILREYFWRHFMLITFTSKAYPDITMFGEAALHLIKMMGHSGVVPSAIMAEDVPAALERLKNAIQSDIRVPPPAKSSDVKEEESHEQSVSLKNRALPLIELLAAAAKEKCDVMWKTM